MSSSKTKDYDVENIVSKRTDGKGQVFYLIKWKGYSSTDNSWEPENHVANCPDMIKAFEAEQAKKNKSKNSNGSQVRTSQRSTRSGSSPSKRSTRTSNRNSTTGQHNKRTSSDESNFTDDEDDNGYNGKKLIKSLSSKRLRKSTTDTNATPSVDSYDSDILDTTKLDQILDVRRNKRTDTVEYHIQVKKIKKPIWIKSDRLTDDYSQQVVDFLEEKYI